MPLQVQVHAIGEYARRGGHAGFLRERIDGGWASSSHPASPGRAAKFGAEIA